MKLTKKEGSNYTMTVVKLPKIQDVPGFDNLGMVTIFGNDCLVSKNSPESIWYLFIPAGTKLSPIFMHNNNLYTDPLLNKDHTKKGYIKDNGHVRAVKMKGVISTVLVMPAKALEYLNLVRAARGINVPVNTSSKAVFMDELVKEFRKETYAEGQLFYLYKRLNRGILMENGATTPPSDKIFVLPVPNDELEYGQR